MIARLRKCVLMLSPEQRRRWLLLVPLSLVTSALEAGAAAMVFVVFKVLNDPAAVPSIPWVSRLIGWLPSQDPAALPLQLIGVAAVYHLVKTAFGVAANYIRHRIQHDTNTAVAIAMVRRYLAAPYSFYFRRNSAELMRNCNGTAGSVMASVLGTALSCVSEAMVAIALGVVLLRAAPGLAVLAGVSTLVLLFVILWMTRGAAVRFGNRAHMLNAEILKTLHHAFGAAKEIKALGREPYYFNEFVCRQRQFLELGNAGITLGYLPFAALQTVLVIGGLGVIALMIALGESGAATLPVVGLFAYAGVRLMPTINWLFNAINTFRANEGPINELYDDYLSLTRAIADQETLAARPFRFTSTIELQHVTFGYPGSDRHALEDVSLAIRRGESIGIVGPTGSGKSTLVDVILGLLPPTQGSVLVDGDSIGHIGPPWRSLVGYVPQAGFIADDTLRRNIALGIADDEIDDGRIVETVVEARLENVVANLPNALDTKLGERGIRLSGGERQRIAIARALYHRPEFLVLDEATSALDLQTEADVLKTIDQLKGRRTLLIVAHRLTTVRHCDRIIYLQNGRVAGVGSFDELRARNPEFNTLAALATV